MENGNFNQNQTGTISQKYNNLLISTYFKNKLFCFLGPPIASISIAKAV